MHSAGRISGCWSVHLDTPEHYAAISSEKMYRNLWTRVSYATSTHFHWTFCVIDSIYPIVRFNEVTLGAAVHTLFTEFEDPMEDILYTNGLIDPWRLFGRLFAERGVAINIECKSFFFFCWSSYTCHTRWTNGLYRFYRSFQIGWFEFITLEWPVSIVRS